MSVCNAATVALITRTTRTALLLRTRQRSLNMRMTDAATAALNMIVQATWLTVVSLWIAGQGPCLDIAGQCSCFCQLFE